MNQTPPWTLIPTATAIPLSLSLLFVARHKNEPAKSGIIEFTVE